MAGLTNGSSHFHINIPTIKFTKLFINGEFLDSVSGAFHPFFHSQEHEFPAALFSFLQTSDLLYHFD